MTEIMVNIMAEVLLILAIMTKELKCGRMSESIPTVELPSTYSSSERFFQKLIGRSGIEDALRRLETLMQEEHRMATAQDLRATHRVDDRTRGIDDKTEVLINGGLLLFARCTQILF
jgi:hypothetical protein